MEISDSSMGSIRRLTSETKDAQYVINGNYTCHKVEIISNSRTINLGVFFSGLDMIVSERYIMEA